MLLLFIPILIVYLVGGLFLCAYVGRVVGRKTGSKLIGVGGFLLLFGLIFGDEIYAHLTWRYWCAEKAGVHVYRVVPVDGFLFDDGAVDVFADDFLLHGYKYIEGGYHKNHGADRGDIYRFSYGESKTISRIYIQAPASSYIYRTDIQRISNYVWGSARVVQNRLSGEVVGEAYEFGYSGGYVARLIRRWLGADMEGSASYCSADVPRRDVILESIPPKNGHGE
ncbi:hypothetical protein D9M70_203640 [compost metagenome]